MPLTPPCRNTIQQYYNSYEVVNQGSPYLQHRVATLLVQHGRRHQNYPTRNPFLKCCRFRLCLVQAAVVKLFVLNLVCFISVCPCIPGTGRLENKYSCCGFWLWSWLAAVVNLFVLNLLCFISVYLVYTRNGHIVEHVRTEKKQKRPCRAVRGTWLHVGAFLAGVLTQRFSTQPLSRCTYRGFPAALLSRSSPAPSIVDKSLKTPVVPVYTHTDLNVETTNLGDAQKV